MEPLPPRDPNQVTAGAIIIVIRDSALSIIAAVKSLFVSVHEFLKEITGILIIVAGIIAYFHTGKAITNIEQTKNLAEDTNKTQKAVVAVEVRGTPQDVEALKATTQP